MSRAIPEVVPVLLVEDDGDDALLASLALRSEWSAEFDINLVTTLAEALEPETLERAAVVVADLHLPDATGLEVVQRLRMARPGAPLIILTNTASPEIERQALRLGAQDFLYKAEVSGRTLARSVLFALERRRQDSELAAAALRDDVTGLASRALVSEAIPLSIGRLQREPGWVAVLVIDIDGFKAVNDTHGHLAGDRVLRSVGERIANSLRPFDVLGRWGGDEFVAVCQGHNETRAIDRIIDRIRATIATDPYDVGSRPLRLRASVGAAFTARPDADPAHLFEAADQAMYRDKRGQGPTIVEVARPDLVDLTGEDTLAIG